MQAPQCPASGGRQAGVARPAPRRGPKLSSRRRSPLYHPPRRQPRWARRHHRSTHVVFQRNRLVIDRDDRLALRLASQATLNRSASKKPTVPLRSTGRATIVSKAQPSPTGIATPAAPRPSSAIRLTCSQSKHHRKFQICLARIKRSGPFSNLKAYAIDVELLRTRSANFSSSGERQQDNDWIAIHQAVRQSLDLCLPLLRPHCHSRLPQRPVAARTGGALLPQDRRRGRGTVIGEFGADRDFRREHASANDGLVRRAREWRTG